MRYKCYVKMDKQKVTRRDGKVYREPVGVSARASCPWSVEADSEAEATEAWTEHLKVDHPTKTWREPVKV